MRILLFSALLLAGLSVRAQTPEQQTPPAQEQISEERIPDAAACAAEEAETDSPAEETETDSPAAEACGVEEPVSKEPLFEGMPDVMPTFNDGDIMSFHCWVAMQVRYPQEALMDGIQGRVFVEYVIEKDGSVSEVRIVRSPDKRLSEEVMRVFGQQTLVWTPAMQNGNPVRMKFSIPVDFRYQ